jgi:hypothetical protein
MLNVFFFLSVITFSSINAQKTHVLLVSTVTCQGKACAYGYAAEVYFLESINYDLGGCVPRISSIKETGN